ncbi:hypothetical protein HELRODRAFT_185506 [Helobdella robusta]|uniref:6-phosphofructo-2-kinase domain-containing protein n=1 Tax=Helobdella robusta TaxID=6412 RepID=T1FMW7_HELRO|nr:hypothetical protein HELRODRAFT_185506 [Helobdella robusta]ESO05219.1 hypothetical protein HELRODRAFT_185506 [Helobdella robusta]
MEIDKTKEVVLRCAIIMVGLPARGKTYMSKKLARYLNWIGYRAKVFNVGEARRQEIPTSINNADFFRADNSDAIEMRNKCAMSVLQQMLQWMKDSGPSIGIYDATNSTKARRRLILEHLMAVHNVNILFVESLCDDPDVIETNIKDVKIMSPDYENVSREQAVEDFKQRIKYYERSYEPLDIDYDKNISFLKIFNLGSKFIANKIKSHMQSRIIYYFMNISVLPRVIYITRAGETNGNMMGLVGGDDDLSDRGIQYARSLAEFIDRNNMKDIVVWSSLMRSALKTCDTLKPFVATVSRLKALNELDNGSFEGLTQEDIRCRFPEEYTLRENDKYYYRYPSGESYQDLVVRLEPIIMELEKVSNVMVVCHQAVARCLLAYLLDEPREDVPYLDVPLHTVFKLTPHAYGCKVDRISFNIPAVNNYRPKPKGLVSVTSFDESRLRRKMSYSSLTPTSTTKL